MRERVCVTRGSDVYLGLDISKSSWHVTARSGGETLMSASFPPKREALNGLLERLGGCRIHSAYETGPFGYGLHDWLRSRQVDSMVVSAAHVPGEIGNRVKTDRRDGLKLARTLEAGLLRPIFVPEARQRADREYVRQRQRVQRDRCAAMVRIKSFFLTYDIEVPEEAGAHWSVAFEAWLRGLKLEDHSLDRVLEELRGLYFDLDARVDGLTKELRQMARSADYAPMVELLSTVPGIGWLTALTLVVEIVDFGRFPDGEALSSYAGLTPSEHSSGDRVRHGHITRQGNPVVRSVLVESSWILIGKDPEMRRFYDRIKVRRGGKRAIVAVARKLCHRLLAIAHSGNPYRVNFSQTKEN
jgi:transposase